MSYSSEVLADSPAIFLPLTESSGTNADDATANNRDGTYTGTYSLASLAPTANLSAVVDLATTAYVEVPNGSWMNFGSAFTVEFWFRLDSLPGTGGARATLVSIRDSTNAGSSFQIQVFNNQLDAFFFWNTTGGLREAVGSTVLSANTWYHVAVTIAGGTMIVYLNAASDGSVTYATASMPSPTRPLRIGNDERADRNGIDGKIGYVAIYPTTLSGARISAHYSAASAISVTGEAFSGSAAALDGTAKTDIRVLGDAATGSASALNGSALTAISVSGEAFSGTVLALDGTIPTVPIVVSGENFAGAALALDGAALTAIRVSGDAFSGSANALDGLGRLRLGGDAFMGSAVALEGFLPGFPITIEGDAFSGSAVALSGSVPVFAGTDTSNAFQGRTRGGLAVATVLIPFTPTGVTRVDKAVPLPTPDMVDGRPT